MQTLAIVHLVDEKGKPNLDLKIKNYVL